MILDQEDAWLCPIFGPLLDLSFETPELTRSVGRYVLERFAEQELRLRSAQALSRLHPCADLTADDLKRTGPDIGATVYRNLVLGLAQKLARADGLVSPPPHSPAGEPDVC